MSASVLVVGIGNRLLSDDGVGLDIMERLRDSFAGREGIEFIDGGTLGLALLAYLEGRRAVLLLDAVSMGGPPGTVHELGPDDIDRAARGGNGGSACESGAMELMATARLIGVLPDHFYVVGIEPTSTRAGVGLSAVVTASLPQALTVSGELIEKLLSQDQ